MGINVQLSTKQINQIAFSISPKKVSDYVEAHQKEYNQFLEEEEKGKNKGNNFTSNNAIWTFYTDDTICKVKLDDKKTEV